MTQLVDVKEAAELLRIRVSTVRAWIAARKLPVVRCGRCVRVPLHAIEEFIERNTVPAREGRDAR